MPEEKFGKVRLLPPEPNFHLTMGEEDADVVFEFRVTKNLFNKIKWWLFCRFFPFRVTKWDKI